MLKKFLTYLGSIIALISLVFVAQQLAGNWHKIDSYQFTLESGGFLLLGAISYGSACYLLSSAWYKILNSLCSSQLQSSAVRSIYARSQIAKYIPGNVMQLAGRHILTRRLGVSHKPLIIASLVEILGLIMASCTLTTIGSVVFGLWGNYINHQQLYYGLAILAVFLLSLPIIYKLCLKLTPSGRKFLNTPHLLWIFIRAYLEYLIFFMLAGSVLVGLVFQLHGVLNIYNIAAVIASFSVSWLMGFITPGAPSGIGIRETILIVSLDKILLGNSGALIAILFRVVTIVGDVLFFSIAGRGDLARKQ